MLVTSRKVVDGWLDEWMDDSWFVKLIKQEYLSVYSWHGEIFIAIRNWNLVCWGVWLWRIENIDELRDFFSSLWNEWIIIIIIIQISHPILSTWWFHLFNNQTRRASSPIVFEDFANNKQQWGSSSWWVFLSFCP